MSFLANIFVITFTNISSLWIMVYIDSIIKLLLPQTGNRKGGVEMLEVLISLIVSIIAGVITHYICKWLDEYLGQ